MYSQQSTAVSLNATLNFTPLRIMSFLPRQRPAPLVDDDEDGGNGDGSVQLDSTALLLATAYLLAYLALHTLTGWASIATVVPLTAALLYHWYHDLIPRSTAASIDREQLELSAIVKRAVVHCSNRKKSRQQQQQQQHRHRVPTHVVVDLSESQEQKGSAEEEAGQSLQSPHLHLQLTSPNAHSHFIELADDSAAARHDTRAASEEQDEGEEDEEEKAVGSSRVKQQQRAAAAAAVTSPTRSSATAAAVLSPKTPTTVLDADET